MLSPLFYVLYGVIMNDKEKKGNPPMSHLEKNIEKLEKAEDIIISDELTIWMTESTHPYLVPRSDGG